MSIKSSITELHQQMIAHQTAEKLLTEEPKYGMQWCPTYCGKVLSRLLRKWKMEKGLSITDRPYNCELTYPMSAAKVVATVVSRVKIKHQI